MIVPVPAYNFHPFQPTLMSDISIFLSIGTFTLSIFVVVDLYRSDPFFINHMELLIIAHLNINIYIAPVAAQKRCISNEM